MKKLYLILFALPLFSISQNLPTIYSETNFEERYVERGKLFEESYHRFLNNINQNMSNYDDEGSWGDEEECENIFNHYKRTGTITERMWIDLSCVCSPFCYERGITTSKNASSTLSPHGDYNYNVSNIDDYDPRTAWVEGRSDYGIGEYFEINAFDPHPGTLFFILNGLQKSVNLWKYNSRVKTFKIYYNETPLCYLRLEDNMQWQSFNLSDMPDDLDSYHDGDDRRNITFRFEIVDVYPGMKWKDVCITEIRALNHY